MIIGHGDIASVLNDRDAVLFFAAGVSNSNETRDSEYMREYELMAQQRFDKHIVYFSSLCVFLNPDTRYAKHKREMEELVKQCPSYSIVRLGNIEWGVNPHTWINYLRAHPDAEVKEVWRHVVSAHEFLYWMDKIRVGEKEEMNIPGRMVWVPDYVQEIKNTVSGIAGESDPEMDFLDELDEETMKRIDDTIKSFDGPSKPF